MQVTVTVELTGCAGRRRSVVLDAREAGHGIGPGAEAQGDDTLTGMSCLLTFSGFVLAALFISSARVWHSLHVFTVGRWKDTATWVEWMPSLGENVKPIDNAGGRKYAFQRRKRNVTV